MSAVVCSEEVVFREMVTLMADLDCTVPAEVVSDVVSAAADELDGQVPLGGIAGVLASIRGPAAERLPRQLLVSRPPSRFICSDQGNGE